jgi:hypothetical protein
MIGKIPNIRVACAARDPYVRDLFANCVSPIYVGKYYLQKTNRCQGQVRKFAISLDQPLILH